jgi:hypothetical protein
MTISLGRKLPHASCSLPDAADLAIQVTSSLLPLGLHLLDLAPGGGYLAADVTACAGGLLHHLFTLTLSCSSPNSRRNWERLGGGGLSLWPDPSGCPVPGVTRRLALWSADFPRWHKTTAIIRSAWGYSSYHNFIYLLWHRPPRRDFSFVTHYSDLVGEGE